MHSVHSRSRSTIHSVHSRYTWWRGSRRDGARGKTTTMVTPSTPLIRSTTITTTTSTTTAFPEEAPKGPRGHTEGPVFQDKHLPEKLQGSCQGGSVRPCRKGGGGGGGRVRAYRWMCFRCAGGGWKMGGGGWRMGGWGGSVCMG